MINISLNIWGRLFDLDIVYQNYSDELSSTNQNNFTSTITAIDFMDSLEELKKYIMQHDSTRMDESSIQNIFKYVVPETIFIPFDDEKSVFAILCNYRFDLEHGLAVVYEDGHFKEVGPQDIIL